MEKLSEGYNTKVMLALVADIVARSKSAREAYMCIANAANIEGTIIVSYDEKLSERELED